MATVDIKDTKIYGDLQVTWLANLWAVNYWVDTWASDTYVVTITPEPLPYQNRAIYTFKANTANTGAATINFNSLWAKTIVKWVNTTLANNDILALMYCVMVYDWTNMVLLNPRTL